MDQQQRNLIIAIALSALILFGFEYLTPRPKVAHTPPEAQQTTQIAGQQSQPSAAALPVPAAPAPLAAAAPREEVLAKAPRVGIDTPQFSGSINLVGARFDDLTLKNYHETANPNSAPIVLLAPDSSEHPYFAQFGWVAAGSGPKLPDETTRWTSSGGDITIGHPVELTWDNGAGLRFVRRYAVDERYVFTVTQTVENTGSTGMTLFPYALVSRSGKPPASSTWILHEGPIGVFNGTLNDSVSYSKLKAGEPPMEFPTTGGWVGITDKYWLVALVPDQGMKATDRFIHTERDHTDVYQVDYTGDEHTVPAGGSISITNRLFAGAKEYDTLSHYENAEQIPLLNRAIDFGYLYLITKPIFLALDFFSHWLGNFGLAILLFTLLVKLAFFPLANKSYRAMAKMKLLQPEMARLRETFGDDKARLNQEIMAAYKRVGANPLAGCLPVIIQIPVFWSLYKVLYVTIEMRNAPFYGWIHDLSSPDPTSFVNLFGLLPIAVPHISFLQIGLWPLVMGATMFLQQKLNPPPPDPMQARMMTMMPVVFTFMLAQMPAGLVIYWSWNNLLSITQQYMIMHRAKAA